MALVRGTATIEVDGLASALSAGDYILIPAHTKHRVLACSADALWLAVHVR